jgi:hypothetical protein
MDGMLHLRCKRELDDPWPCSLRSPRYGTDAGSLAYARRRHRDVGLGGTKIADGLARRIQTDEDGHKGRTLRRTEGNKKQRLTQGLWIGPKSRDGLLMRTKPSANEHRTSRNDEESNRDRGGAYWDQSRRKETRRGTNLAEMRHSHPDLTGRRTKERTTVL